MGDNGYNPREPRDIRGRWTKLAEGELAGMAAEAKKHKTFADFEHAWLQRGLRGQYWHLTSKEKFAINPNYVPKEYASDAAEGLLLPGLMVSPYPDDWHPQLPKGRKWAAEIDLGRAKEGEDYNAFNRGFGSEIFIKNPGKVTVKRIVPWRQAVEEERRYTEIGPQSPAELREFYDTVWAQPKQKSLILLSGGINNRSGHIRYPGVRGGRRLDNGGTRDDTPVIDKSHDVSHEARDERGRWTAVGRLVKNLKRHNAPELHDLIDNVHWALGSSGAVSKVRAARRYVDYSTGALATRMTGYANAYDAFAKVNPPMALLDTPDKRTLRQLVYGDIPAEWEHDPAYLDHLRKWARGSKLLDEEGLPYRLYHGTENTFRQFDPAKRGSATHKDDAKRAFFFTASPEDAGFFSFYPTMQRYDESRDEPSVNSGSPNVMPVHVRLRKPLMLVDDSGGMNMEYIDDALKLAKRKDYDGLVVYEGSSPFRSRENEDGELPFKVVGETNYDAAGSRALIYDAGNTELPRTANMVVMAFSPTDVKSATGNAGTFDESSDMGKSHDVSGEPRDKDGRWVALERLDDTLKRKKLGSRAALVRTLIDDTNSNRLGPRGYLYNIASVSEANYDPEVPYTSSPDTIATVRQLDSQDRDTLRRLVYGDIPVSLGRDTPYLDHLKHWAKGSKLVDQDGLPYRVFHGSDAKFRAFSIKKRGSATHYQDAKKAFFFGASPTDASHFATFAYRNRKNPGKDRAPQIYPAYVRLKNPLVVIDGGGAMSAKVMKQALDYAADHDYDGVVMYEQDTPAALFGGGLTNVGMAYDPYDSRGRGSGMFSINGTLPRGGDMVVAVINPTDIKSASGNAGTFDESADLGKSYDPNEPRDEEGKWTKGAQGMSASWPKGLPPIQFDPNETTVSDLMRVGNFDLSATKRPNKYYGDNDYVVTAMPRLDSRYHQPVPPAWKNESPKEWYDTRLAHIETEDYGEGYTPSFVRPNSNLPAEYSEELPVKQEPGKLWRGLSWGEMQTIKKTGKIHSSGTHNIGDIQKGLTYFADDPRTAESYAGNFAPAAFIPTFDRPSYIVKVSDPGPAGSVRLPHIEGEVGLKGDVPASRVEEVYELLPYAVEKGEHDLVTDHGSPVETFHTGSGVKAGASYVFRKIIDVPGFLRNKERPAVAKSHDVSSEPRNEKGEWARGRWSKQARDHGMSEKAYMQAANENLRRVIKPARTWIGVSPEHLAGVLDTGKYLSRLDDSLALEDDDSAAWVNETRRRIEQHFFGTPDVNPAYGFLSTNPTEGLTTDRDQPGDNYGSAFIKLKPEVDKRSGIFVGDSGSTYMPEVDGFGEPVDGEKLPEIDAELSPLTNPNIRSIPKSGGVDPLKIKKLSDIKPYVEVLVRPEGDGPAISIPDIEEVVFTDTPDKEMVDKLHEKGIPFRVFERPQGDKTRVPTNEREAIDFAVKNPFDAVFGKVNPDSTEPKLQKAKKMNMSLTAYGSSTGHTTGDNMGYIKFGGPGYTQAVLTLQELERLVRNGDIPVMTKETIESAQNPGHLFNPWWQGNIGKSVSREKTVTLAKASRDVSQEPRDPKGEWTKTADNHHGNMAGKRGLEPNVPYWVYLNLHLGTKKPLISKKTGQPVINPKTGRRVMVPAEKVWSMRNWKTGLVDKHARTVYLKDVRIHIGASGRRAVIRTGQKNVHAGLVGIPVAAGQVPVDGWVDVHYNPKDHPELTHGFFMIADEKNPDQRISHAKFARFTPRGTQVWGPSYSKGVHDDDVYQEQVHKSMSTQM